MGQRRRKRTVHGGTQSSRKAGGPARAGARESRLSSLGNWLRQQACRGIGEGVSAHRARDEPLKQDYPPQLSREGATRPDRLASGRADPFDPGRFLPDMITFCCQPTCRRFPARSGPRPPARAAERRCGAQNLAPRVASNAGLGIIGLQAYLHSHGIAFALPNEHQGVPVMSKKLEGQVAVVTGASKGIGAAIAEHFAAAGAAVVVNYASSRAGAEAVVKRIRQTDGKAVAVQADVSRLEDVRRLFAETKKAFGKLDILVNNAGIYEFLPLEGITTEHFRKQFDINVLGLLLT